jgi:hypothetical protein
VDAVRVGTATTTAAAEATLAAGRTDEEIVAGLLLTTMDGRRCRHSQVARLVEAGETTGAGEVKEVTKPVGSPWRPFP